MAALSDRAAGAEGSRRLARALSPVLGTELRSPGRLSPRIAGEAEKATAPEISSTNSVCRRLVTSTRHDQLRQEGLSLVSGVPSASSLLSPGRRRAGTAPWSVSRSVSVGALEVRANTLPLRRLID